MCCESADGHYTITGCFRSLHPPAILRADGRDGERGGLHQRSRRNRRARLVPERSRTRCLLRISNFRYWQTRSESRSPFCLPFFDARSLRPPRDSRWPTLFAARDACQPAMEIFVRYNMHDLFTSRKAHLACVSCWQSIQLSARLLLFAHLLRSRLSRNVTVPLFSADALYYSTPYTLNSVCQGSICLGGRLIAFWEGGRTLSEILILFPRFSENFRGLKNLLRAFAYAFAYVFVNRCKNHHWECRCKYFRVVSNIHVMQTAKYQLRDASIWTDLNFLAWEI